MDAAHRGPFWDTGDDRSQVFVPVAAAPVRALKRRPDPAADVSRFAANEETAAAALFRGTAARAAR